MDELEAMLKLAVDEFDTRNLKQEFSSLDKEEAMATNFNDETHSIYERRREIIAPKIGQPKYRIKSIDGNVPPSKLKKEGKNPCHSLSLGIFCHIRHIAKIFYIYTFFHLNFCN